MVWRPPDRDDISGACGEAIISVTQDSTRSARTEALGDIDYRLVFDATPAPYLLLAPDAPRFTIVGVNDAYLAATGTRREIIVGQGLFEVFPDNPHDPTATGVSDLRASLERALRDRAPDAMGVQKYDIPLRDGSGAFEVRYWSPINTPVIASNGSIDHIIHRAEDVTQFILAQQTAEQVGQLADLRQAEVLRSSAELKEANRQLKEVTGLLAELNALQAAQAQARLSFAMNAAGMGEVILDPVTDRAVHSPGLARLLGYPPETILTREQIREGVHPDDRELVANYRDSALISAGEQFEMEHRVLWPDGTVRWLDNRGRVTRDADGRAVEVTAVFMDITERKKAEEQQQQLLAELNHRMNNTLATVMAISGQTRRGAVDPETFGRIFEGRIGALANAHDLLTAGSWDGAALADVVGRTLAPYASGDPSGPTRVTIDGPPIRLSPNAAVTMNMAIHELTTNAARYGALSTPEGRLDVRWRRDESAVPAELALTWNESGGPTVVPPRRRGFGSRLIEQGLGRELGGNVNLWFAPAGVQCEIHLPLSRKVSLG